MLAFSGERFGEREICGWVGFGFGPKIWCRVSQRCYEVVVEVFEDGYVFDVVRERGL